MLPEACVIDVQRGRAVFGVGKDILSLLDVAQDGNADPSSSQVIPGLFHCDATSKDGKESRGAKLELIRIKNKFDRTTLDPTRFRNVLVSFRMHVDYCTPFFVELQMHQSVILDHNNDSGAHDVYDFFRAKLADAYESGLDEMLDRALTFMLDEVCQNPVLLSLLIVAVRNLDTSSQAPLRLPSSLIQLYEQAIVFNVIKDLASSLDMHDAYTITFLGKVLRKIALANMEHGSRSKRHSLPLRPMRSGHAVVVQVDKRSTNTVSV